MSRSKNISSQIKVQRFSEMFLQRLSNNSNLLHYCSINGFSLNYSCSLLDPNATFLHFKCIEQNNIFYHKKQQYAVSTSYDFIIVYFHKYIIFARCKVHAHEYLWLHSATMWHFIYINSFLPRVKILMWLSKITLLSKSIFNL